MQRFRVRGVLMHQPAQSGQRGLKRVWSATLNSFRGLRWMLKHETAFQQEMVIFIIASGVTFFLDVSVFKRCLMIAALLLVLLTEIINTAIEAAIDRIGPERHKLSGLAKDAGSAAVMVSMLICILIWLGVLWS